MDIEYEKRLLDILELEIKEVEENDNYLLIVSPSLGEVGNIRRVYTKNSSKERIPYINKMYFNTGNIIYSDKKYLDVYENQDSYEYTFKVINNGVYYLVNLALGEKKTISVKELNTDKNVATFSILDDSFDFSFSRLEEGHFISETVVVSTDGISSNESYWTHKGQIYQYQVLISKEGEYSIEDSLLAVNTNSKNLFLGNTSRSLVTEKITKNGKKMLIKNENRKEYISDIIINHQLGIIAFQKLREFFKSIIPTKKDIILMMLEERELKEYPFTLFVPELKKKVNLAKYDMITEYKDGIVLGYYMIKTKRGNVYNNMDVIVNNQVINFGRVISRDIDNSKISGFYDFFENYIMKYPDGINIDEIFDLSTMERIYDNDRVNEIVELIRIGRKNMIRNRKKKIETKEK